MGRDMSHASTLQCVELPRKELSYESSKDRLDGLRQSVGVLGPHYPNQLRAWREFRKLTQEQLAEAANCSPATVGHIENGARRLSDKWANVFAQALETRPGYLFDTDPETLPTAILDVWDSIPEERREQALQILQTFARTGTDN